MILYSWDLSPPVRAVKIVARLLDLELEIWYINGSFYRLKIVFFSQHNLISNFRTFLVNWICSRENTWKSRLKR